MEHRIVVKIEVDGIETMKEVVVAETETAEQEEDYSTSLTGLISDIISAIDNNF